MRFKSAFTKIVLMAERSFMQCRNKLIEAVIMLNVIMLSVGFYLLLCWMSLCWVSLCWVLLCWVSLRWMSLCWVSSRHIINDNPKNVLCHYQTWKQISTLFIKNSITTLFLRVIKFKTVVGWWMIFWALKMVNS